MSTTPFLIALLCTMLMAVLAYYTIPVKNGTRYLTVGIIGSILMICSFVLDALSIGELPTSLILAIMMLIGLGAFGWGMGGAMKQWMNTRYGRRSPEVP